MYSGFSCVRIADAERGQEGFVHILEHSRLPYPILSVAAVTGDVGIDPFLEHCVAAAFKLESRRQKVMIDIIYFDSSGEERFCDPLRPLTRFTEHRTYLLIQYG